MYHNTGYAENACPSLTKLNETEGVVVTAVVDDEYDKMLHWYNNSPANQFNVTFSAYLIEADPFNVVEIEIQGLISSSDCLQDNLGIYDGDTDHHRNIATVCGSPTPKIFTTTQDKALVVWHLGSSLKILLLIKSFLDIPDSTKKAQFYFRQKLNPFKSDLVEIPRPTFTTTTERITDPDKSHVTCVKCMHNVTRVDSNICRKNYIFEGQIRTPVKRIGELWYTKVRVLDNFKTGEIEISKSMRLKYAMTKVFLACNLCPKLERRKTYIFTGRELHAYNRRGNSFLYPKISQSDYILPRIRKRFTEKIIRISAALIDLRIIEALLIFSFGKNYF